MPHFASGLRLHDGFRSWRMVQALADEGAEQSLSSAGEVVSPGRDRGPRRGRRDGPRFSLCMCRIDEAHDPLCGRPLGKANFLRPRATRAIEAHKQRARRCATTPDAARAVTAVAEGVATRRGSGDSAAQVPGLS